MVDIKQLMEMANQLRGQLSDATAKAAEARYVGEAGGGLVRVVVNGRHEVMEIKIDPEAVDREEIALLEDLLRAAFNQAASQIAVGLRDQVGHMAQGLGIDPSLFGNLDLGGDKQK